MKIDVVILAAGSSKRYGKENKLLVKIAGKSLIERALLLGVNLKTALPNLISNLLVVSCYEEVKALALKYNYKYIENVNSSKGISTSIHLGVKNSQNALLFMVADEPYLTCDTLVKLVLAYHNSDKNLATLIDETGQTANPCLFGQKYHNDLLALMGDKGGKKIILNNLADTILVKVNSAEVKDIDYHITEAS